MAIRIFSSLVTARTAFLCASFLAGLLVLLAQGRLYADTGTWVSGDFPVLSVGQVSTDLPPPPKTCVRTSFTYFTYGTNPYSEGQNVTTNGCQMSNLSGTFYNTGNYDTATDFNFVSPGTSIAFRVLRPGGRASDVMPIPNQAGFLWMEGSTRWGNPVAPHFYNDLRAAGDFGQYSYGSNIVPWDLAYELNTAGSTLNDSAGHKLYMHAHAFSPNGQWMVIEADGLGLVRINTTTLEMQLFDNIHLAYNLGFSPQMALAISNDGNSVIRAGQDAGSATVYDLSGCQGGSFATGIDNTAAMAGCQSRNVQQSLRSQVSNFQYMTRMRFSPDGKSISALVISTGLNGIRLYNTAQYSVAGYIAPNGGYIALGDSFSSGEGTYDYVPGTNTGENSCHLSYSSYPYIAASALEIADFHSVACSGAMTSDYANGQKNQNKDLTSPLGNWIPGYQGQGKYFNLAGKTSVVTISMIGNDIGFSDKLKRCVLVADPCFHFKEDRQSIADEIYGKFHTLVSLYQQIKTDSGNGDNVKVYVLGYPQIVGNGSCGANVWFDPEERQMAQGLISYLNAIIRAATINAGVQYIDVEHAFDGHRLCESSPFAVNGLSVDKNVIHSLGDLFTVLNSSFHPDPLGHQLMSQALLLQSVNFTKLMPPASSVSVPYAGSAEYDAFVNGTPTGGTATRLIYVGASETLGIYKGTLLVIDIPKKVFLKSLSQFQVWFNSEPIYAGTLTSDENGNLSGSVEVPSGVEPGYHTVHIYGKNGVDQDIDMYEMVYVAASPDDFNGDGIPNDQDACLIIPASGADQDGDGIDDACDPEIADPPADTVPPTVNGTADRTPDYNGWYTDHVTIAWSSSDPEPSSGAPTQPTPTTANDDGDHTYTSDESCDPAGNCASGTMQVKIDKTPPDIAFTVDPLPNVFGWNNTAAMVTFNCQDTTSGVESCTSPVLVSSEGGNLITGVARDNAGNESSVNAVVAIDTTPPTVGSTVMPVPNGDGWNNTDVQVVSSCSDGLSGIASCSGTVDVTSEGNGQQVSLAGIDKAGNSGSTATTVNIDKTAPTIDAFDWTNNPRTTDGIAMLSVHASDNLSGIKQVEYFLGDADPGVGNATSMYADGTSFTAAFNTSLETGVYKVTMRAEDAAGNWGTASSDYLVVYNPFSVRMVGHRFLVPSLAAGDELPGLESDGQPDTVKFAFSVGYDAQGRMLPNNAFQLAYDTGEQCNNPAKASNCHSFSLNANTIDWLTTQGLNNSVGIFQGEATLSLDRADRQVVFTLTGLDGQAKDLTSPDHLQLKVYKYGDNVSSATPIYYVDDEVARGNIHVGL